MKRNILIFIAFLVFCLGMLAGCDPVFPEGDLEVAPLSILAQGTSVKIEIIYPPTHDSIFFTFGWKDQNIEIVNGTDVVAVSGLTITGLKPGTALIRVNATTFCGEQEGVYSTEVEVQVK